MSAGADRRPWYQRGPTLWLAAGGLTAALLAFVAYATVRGRRAEVTTTAIGLTALADGSLLVLERVDRAVADGDGGRDVTTTYRRRRLGPDGAELARAAAAGPERCVAAIDDRAWCTSQRGLELVDGQLQPALRLADLGDGRLVPPDTSSPWVDAAGRLLLRDRDGRPAAVEPRTGRTALADGDRDPGRMPAAPALTARAGERTLELRARGPALRVLRASDRTYPVEAGPDVAAEPGYRTDGLLATETGVALALAGDLLLVERLADGDAARQLTRVTVEGARRWSAPLPGPVSQAAIAGSTVVLLSGGRVHALDAATGVAVGVLPADRAGVRAGAAATP